MLQHCDRLAQWRGEHFGCLQFRKIGNWYAKALRAGRELQQQLVRLSSLAEIEEIAERLRDRGPPEDWEAPEEGGTVAVPAGPIAHW
jgi:hypothetical protein